MSKPSPPTPASPQVTSAAQTQSNVDTAVANAIMGNVNQSSPFGSTSYNQTGTTNVDGYNIPSYAQTTTLNPTLQGILTGQENTAASLVPTGQTLANEAGTSLTTPLNFNGVNNSIIQGGPQALQQGATNTIFGGEYGLLQPIYQQQQQQLRDQLSQQGIPLGSEAYNNAETNLGTQQNQGINAALGNATGQGINAANSMFNLALLGQGQNIQQQQLAQTNPLTNLSMLYGATA